ncbi:MAG: cupredoxin domain-containing protein [Actinomycetota bacterium]
MAMKRALTVIALTAGLLSGCSGGREPSGNASMRPAQTSDAVKLEAGDNVFAPGKLTVASGEELTVEVTNKGRIPHDFTIEELALSTGVLQPGEIATATFTAPDDDVDFVCTLHRGMEGKLEVATQ